MSDVYIEEPEETHVGALEQFRAELSRLRSRLEHRLQASASDVMDETRMFARRAQHRINTQLGASALIAICTGVVLGLLAAIIFGGRTPRGRD
jgi:hypothetical protein